ncbi:hypothetical protein HUJ05_009221, partial [Dendroctonus ponderosae]
TARRGEDGDQNKVRRQPKPVKPKKMIKVDGLHVVTGACNNGTTALVTRDGELLIFGKDTTHADSSTGVVPALKGECVTQVALGKAHGIALTSKGQVYTFGINNKFQCGREFAKANTKDCHPILVVAMDTGPVQEEQDYFEDVEALQQKDSDNMAGGSEGNVGEDAQQNICTPGSHAWHEDLCMVCTMCRECTGYSISCLSSMSSERNPGQECGCGEGDSGCAICGCCRICAREVVDNSELADLAGMMRDNKIIPAKQRTKLHEQIQCRLEDRKSKSKKSGAGSSKQVAKLKSLLATPTHKASSAVRQNNLLGTVKEQTGSDVERDAARVACLPPANLLLPSDSPVVQIACGLHHSVLLLQNGQVLTFGSNLYGQLGCGDILAKNSIQSVKLPTSAVHVAAGSNHTVILSSKGEVFTCGNAEKGQLGRLPSPVGPESSQLGQSSSSSRYANPRTPWYSIAGAIPNVGPRQGRRATWVGASGDQTFLKLDESLINSVSLSKSIVTANKHCIVLFPNYEMPARNFKSLVINKKDGNCHSFKGDYQEDFTTKMLCMDPIYNILWSYDASKHEVCCYNIIAPYLQSSLLVSHLNKLSGGKGHLDVKVLLDQHWQEKEADLNNILKPELALPVTANCQVTRFQAALNLLCCLDTLTIAHNLQICPVKEETEVVEPIHILSKEFSRTVTKECFQSLLSLLQWSWNTFKWGIMEGSAVKNFYTNLELERLVYISTSSLRLLCTYTNEIYPRQVTRKSPLENVHLAKCIGDVRSLLKQILSDNVPLQMQSKKSCKSKPYNLSLMNQILHECHNTFVSCFHAFYPTAYLKWTCLCDLLAETDEAYNPHSSSNTQMLLSAVLCALSSPSIRLRSTFPLLGSSQSADNSFNRGLSPSDNTGHPMMSVSDSHSYPILVEQMSYRSQMESNYTGLSWTWTDVLERLINLVSDPIENIKYAIRLRNHGGRTNNGDGGLNSVKGSDNTTFTFSTCSISFNGTTVTRGQIPILLYYSNPVECGKAATCKLEYQARKTALSMTSSIIENASKLLMLAREKVEEMSSASILSESCVVTILMPIVLSHISPLASSDPKSAVQVLGLIQELLPHVSALNLLGSSTPSLSSNRALNASNFSNQEGGDSKTTTTSNHCTWVESEHPYKPATVANYRVRFPCCVKWMSLEFDASCSTAQPEDSLQLYIPAFDLPSPFLSKGDGTLKSTLNDLDLASSPYWPVLHKFSGSLQWPSNAVILPGNEVVFSLETASDYLKDDRASPYGFKCLVIGYEWPPDHSSFFGLKHLEAELAFLGGMCAASLMKKDLMLPVIGGNFQAEISRV